MFSAAELEAVLEGGSVLGQPKSSSEGAERDREWPTTVPSSDGTVERIQEGRLTIRKADGRRYTYQLGNKTPYLRVGEPFSANRCFLAGTPRRKAEWPVPAGVLFDPGTLLNSQWKVDRYAGAKILGHLGTQRDRAALSESSRRDEDLRVRLEAAGSLARLGFNEGIEVLRLAVQEPEEAYLRMEVALILAELRESASEADAARLLIEMATNQEFAGDEIRQAAIWGLGKAGLGRYSELISYLDCENADERMHAIVAFGTDASNADVQRLVAALASPDSSDTKLASIAFILSRIPPSAETIALLLPLATSDTARVASWARAILGQYPRQVLVQAITDQALLAALQPISLLTPTNNWTLALNTVPELNFLERQRL